MEVLESEASAAKMAASYKSLKEDFVSNLTGGSIGEINLMTAVAPIAALLWSVLQSRHHFFTSYTPLTIVVDFMLGVGSILLSTTLYAPNPVLLNTLLLAPAILLYLVPPSPKPTKSKKRPPPNASTKTPKSPSSGLDLLPRKPFLTTYRGSMLVITCIAILAVDFRIFPRRFAKVENWGTSLMDMGVGSFVFSAGVVAARPILKEQQAGSSRQSTSLASRLYSSGRHSLPLLVLGLIRLWSVKGLDYAEHVSEYGVHWNFFFTLGLLPPFVAVFHFLFALIPSYFLLSLLLAAAYQVLLETTSLKSFILIAPRVDLLSQNREGVFSFLGYLAIFLAGQDTGVAILPRMPPKSLFKKLAVRSLGWMALFWVAYDYRHGLALSVSRRLANLPYVCWVAAFNCMQLTAFFAVEALLFPSQVAQEEKEKEREKGYGRATSRVLHAYNRNGLAVFLLANLLTGLVNLTVPTLDVGDKAAVGILMAYAGVLTGVALLLDKFDVSIKL